MWENIMRIMFIILLAIPLMSLGAYILWNNSTQRYEIKQILCDIEKSAGAEINKRFVLILKSSIERVNGWNLISALYAGMYYCFNLWGFVFSIFGIICAADISTNETAAIWTMICVSITSITMSCQLFFKSERKWRTFARKYRKACIVTNKFLHCVGKCKDPELRIIIYANRIMSIEESIKDEDLL